MSASLTGTCLCKSVKLTIQGTPEDCETCHCRHCQKNAGGPYQINALFPTSAVNVSDPQGYVKKYVIPGSEVNSGVEKHKFFCSNCGCTMFVQLMIHKGEKTIIKTGILDASEGGPGLGSLTPTFETFTKYRASFVKPLDNAKQYHAAVASETTSDS